MHFLRKKFDTKNLKKCPFIKVETKGLTFNEDPGTGNKS